MRACKYQGGLFSRIVGCGCSCQHRLLIEFDGSEALGISDKQFCPMSVIQNCLVHEKRNVGGMLPKRNWGGLARWFRRLRKVQGYEEAQEVLRELQRFLKPINAEATKSLHEAGEDLLAHHRLNVPNMLHRWLPSTNAIESSF